MALEVQRNWDVSMADNLRSMTIKSSASSNKGTVSDERSRSNPSWFKTTFDGPPLHLPAEVLIQIIDFIATQPLTHDLGRQVKQHTLHSCSLVSRDWNYAATPALYADPFLYGPNYDPFTRTICPSINLFVRKSPLASFVRKLDLANLVHQGSKSTTARLLGRTKDSLELFVAPQASFSLNCFPALGKCHRLAHLDLSLVSEAADLKTLFDTVSHLPHLSHFYLPRSAGFEISIDPSSIVWPPNLIHLTLSGGLDATFWRGPFRFPPSLSELALSHCPKLTTYNVLAFLRVLSITAPESLSFLSFKNLPHLDPGSLDIVLCFFPQLPRLAVSVDYITPALLSPDPSLPTEAGHPLSAGPFDLQVLELSDSGDIRDPEAFTPIDILIAAEDEGILPKLRAVTVAAGLGWDQDDLDALDAWLIANAETEDSVVENGFYLGWEPGARLV